MMTVYSTLLLERSLVVHHRSSLLIGYNFTSRKLKATTSVEGVCRRGDRPAAMAASLLAVDGAAAAGKVSVSARAPLLPGAVLAAMPGGQNHVRSGHSTLILM